MLRGLKGFDWDKGNRDKNEKKHGVTNIECEEIFFSKPLVVVEAPLSQEPSYLALGKTFAQRLLFVAFTIRGKMIRVISARPMSRKERLLYEKESKA